MPRRFLSVLVLVLIALRGSALAGAKPDDVTPATNQAKKDFAAALKNAETAFNAGASNLVRSLARGAMTRAAAAASHQAALLTFATTVAKAANDASNAVEAAATEAMNEAVDDSLRGTIVGDAGSLDQFSEFMQTQLESARRYAALRAGKVTAAIAKGSNHSRMNVQLPAWSFDRRAAPALNGALATLGPSADVITMWVGIATRFDDGSVTVAFAGTAPKSSDGNFGIYLVGKNVSGGGDVRAIGKLSDGGIPVTNDRTWTLTATLYQPNVGTPVDPGNRIVHFGVEPFDPGPPAGRQPNRFMVGGVIGIE
jgi:hypothetical protein